MSRNLPKPLQILATQGLSQYFKLNQEAFAPLEQHVGKVIQFEMEAPKASFFLQISEDSIRFVNKTRSDVCLYGQSKSFIKMMGSKDIGPHTLMQHDVKMIGDTSLIEDFMNAVKTWPDIEQWIANLTSDIFAVNLTSSIKSTANLFKSFIKDRTLDITDYATVDTNLLITSPQLAEFGEDIYALSEEIQKLTSRVNQLCARHDGQN